MINSSAQKSLIVAGLLSWSVAALSQSAGQDQSATVADGEDLKITIKEGDTFTGILSRELNSLDAWGEVAKYNKLDSPDDLQPGEVLVIPAEVLRRKNYATVVFVKGTAVHLSATDQTEQPVTKGAKLYLGDRIETDLDGFVSVSFNGGSSVNIQPESTMRISLLKCVDKETACQIKLQSDKGRLGLDVRNSGFSKPTMFSIDTPYASAAVRGTRFDFDVNEGNILGVTEGVVEISLNGASNNIDIGKGVLAGEGQSINTVYDLLPVPNVRLNDGPNYVTDEDVISWDGLDGASKYLVAFAKSESMEDVVTSITATNNITKPDLPLGEFYMTTRGVAANGLRGFKGKKSVTVVDMDSNLEVPELNIEVSDSEMLVSAPDATTVMEFKMGNKLTEIESREYVVGTASYQFEPGQQITVPIDISKDWYLQGRKVVDSGTVSSYGFLYIFEATDQ